MGREEEWGLHGEVRDHGALGRGRMAVLGNYLPFEIDLRAFSLSIIVK